MKRSTGLVTLFFIGMATVVLYSILEEFYHVKKALDRLTASVAALTTADESAALLLSTLAGMIRENAGDPVALNNLADSVDAQRDKLAAAVAANTPLADPPAPGEPTV